MLLHEFKGRIIHMPGIIRQMAKVMTNEGKMSLVEADSLDKSYTFYRFVVKYITSHSIYGVGGKNDNPSAFKEFNGLLNLSLSRIFGMYFQQHEEYCLVLGAKIVNSL
jgi:hypothetical protein